jgi:uncharacterized protein YndB with AHSA1/START domain
VKLHYTLARLATDGLHSQPELPRVERTVELRKSPAELWRHLIDGALASLWMGGEMAIEPRLGGKVTLAAEGLSDLFGSVEAVSPLESIVWTWRTREGEPTQVTLRIEATGEGCRLWVAEQMVPYEIVVIPPVLG